MIKWTQVEETTAKEMDNWKATPQDNVFLYISNGAGLITTKKNYFSTWPDNVQTILCYFLATIPSLRNS